MSNVFNYISRLLIKKNLCAVDFLLEREFPRVLSCPCLSQQSCECKVVVFYWNFLVICEAVPKIKGMLWLSLLPSLGTLYQL